MKGHNLRSIVIIMTLTMLLSGCNGSESADVIPMTATATHTPTEESAKEVEPTIVPTVAPTPTDIPVITEEPPKATSTPLPMPTLESTATPEPTSIPVPTEEIFPTVEPTVAPAATLEPTNTPVPTATPKSTSTPKLTATPTPVVVNGITVDDHILFGSYEQDADLDNGKEPIEWIVLDVKDGKAFLLSKYVLDYQMYDTNYDSQKYWETVDNGSFDYDYHATWEKSSIRSWLNNEFYIKAFDSTEQNNIVSSNVENRPNALRGIDSGKDTKDKVYLLSESEVLKYFGEYWTVVSDENRHLWLGNIRPEQTIQLGEPTEYAIKSGISTIAQAGSPWTEGNCTWGLRTTGGFVTRNITVQKHGFLNQDGIYVNGYDGIRPCLWIDLESADVEKIE